MLSVDMFLHVCLCEIVRCPSPSHSRHQPTHCTGLQTNTHTYTCKRTQARPSLPNPLPQFCSILLLSFLQFVCRIVGGWSFVVGLRGASGRDRWRGGVKKKEKMEVLDGPQLVRAIVSMTCSSLLLSLCLLACSSRSNADKICRQKGEGVSPCYNASQDMRPLFQSKAAGGHQHPTYLVHD